MGTEDELCKRYTLDLVVFEGCWYGSEEKGRKSRWRTRSSYVSESLASVELNGCPDEDANGG